jgi:hypothetical protein
MIVIAPSKKGMNKYEIKGDIAIIYMTRKNGEIIKTKIDAEDLPKVVALDLSWHCRWSPITESYYAMAGEYIGLRNGHSSYKIYYLHSVVMDVEDGSIVDHIDTNTLDNRKRNLRMVSHQNNEKNRQGKNKNNTSGYRNVSWNGYKWIVQLQVDGKNKVLGRFVVDQLDEAGKFAKKMRKKYYGEFAGYN